MINFFLKCLCQQCTTGIYQIRANRWAKAPLNECYTYYESKQLTSIQKDEVQSYFKKYYGQRVDLSWHKFYSSLNGKFYKDYFPTNLFYGKVLPILNRKEMLGVWEDKNMFSVLLAQVNQPVVFFKNMNGLFFDAQNNPVAKNDCLAMINDCCFVIKPSIETGGGKGVAMFVTHNGYMADGSNVIDLLEIYNKDYIVQERIKQHPQMAKLNHSSVNTLRMVTYRTLKKEIVLLSSIIRIGRKSKFVDNRCDGGIFCGVNHTTGKLREVAYSLPSCEKLYCSDEGTIFENLEIPSFSLAKEKVLNWHSLMPYFDLIAWDICIDEQGIPLAVEFNLKYPDIDMMQIANGPLFGGYTSEVLSRICANKTIHS